MTDILQIQTSKSLYCDFLLARLWQKWLKENQHNSDNDFDSLANLNYVEQFKDYLTKVFATDQKLLFHQFCLNSASDLQNQLINSYHILSDKGVQF